MEEFEGQLVDAINHWFEENGDKGVAYRLKQAKYTSQWLDVLVDSPQRYMGIECKSIKTRTVNKIYFTQHFSDNQVERITDYLNESGRDGFLAVELRRGRGRSRKAFIIPWDKVDKAYTSGQVGFALDELGTVGTELPRIGGHYNAETLMGA